MQILLSIDDYEYLEKNATDTIPLINSKIINQDSMLVTVSDYSDFMVELNFAIVGNGMDDEDTVNEIGKRLYNIYDKILYQKHNQSEKS